MPTTELVSLPTDDVPHHPRPSFSKKWRIAFIVLPLLLVGLLILFIHKPSGDADDTQPASATTPSLPDDTPIVFADSVVKQLCVSHWDTNGDGELSMAEAAAVKDFGNVFRGNRDIIAFDEMKYFTGVTTVGSYAFDGCEGLKSVHIPDHILQIDQLAYNACTSLDTLHIGSGVSLIHHSAFTSIPPLACITVSEDNTFYDSRNGCNAVIETATNTRVVGGCKTTIPDDVPIIGEAAFSGCGGFAAIKIPDSVTTIEQDAFAWFYLLSAIEIPSGVTYIGKQAFSCCGALKTVASHMKHPCRLRDGAFAKINYKCVLLIPKGTRSAYLTAGWTEEVFQGGIVEMKN